MKLNFPTLTLLSTLLACTSTRCHAQDLKVVANVDLAKYCGTWFEIASFPQQFQKGCECTTAEYTQTDKAYLTVENRCSRNGTESYIKGKAFIDKNSNNAKLKIQFFWPFKGKYWIIDLAADYSYAVVSNPNKKYLWILSRKVTLDKDVYNGIVKRLTEKGFDLTRLKITRQI